MCVSGLFSSRSRNRPNKNKKRRKLENQKKQINQKERLGSPMQRICRIGQCYSSGLLSFYSIIKCIHPSTLRCVALRCVALCRLACSSELLSSRAVPFRSVPSHRQRGRKPSKKKSLNKELNTDGRNNDPSKICINLHPPPAGWSLIHRLVPQSRSSSVAASSKLNPAVSG